MEQIQWVKLADLHKKQFIVLDVFPAKWKAPYGQKAAQSKEEVPGWKKVFPIKTDLGSFDASITQMKDMAELYMPESVVGKAFTVSVSGKGIETRYEFSKGDKNEELTL